MFTQRLFAPFLTTALATVLITILFPSLALAQEPAGTITGAVVDAETNQSLAGVNVTVEGTRYGAATDAEGRFTIGPLPAGTYTLRAQFVGYRTEERAVEVPAGGGVRVRFALAPRTARLQGVQVTALRPDLQPVSRLQEAEVRRANPRDPGELVRNLTGVSAVRRGPVGLDPVVRGLREMEVGIYIDGMRTFPAGPARMDSPLSHIDPSAIQSIKVIKGPYALTWGAGNMSAVRVETRSLWATDPGAIGGTLHAGYDTNLNAYETTGSVFGRAGKFAYRLGGAWRQGNDYQPGGGAAVPADFLSREVRGKLGYRFAPGQRLTLAGGYQAQDDIDYPGRLLNASFFDALKGRLRYQYERPAGLLRGILRSISAQVYAYRIEHGMSNRGKPTYEPGEFPSGKPRPALRVSVNAEIATIGGRLAAELAPTGALRLKIGGDIYSASRNATRPLQVIMNGKRMTPPFYTTNELWPGVTITDAGLFVNGTRSFGAVEASATARADVVWAGAQEDRVSNRFLDFANVTRSRIDQREAFLSGSFTLSAPLSPHWSLSAGIGSTARTANAKERYSARIPATKAQTAAEFVGNPMLAPERSWQADLWLEANYPMFSLSVSGFARRMTNYITIEPTDIEPLLPLSPPTVYRYVNGEATFYGAEASAAYALTDPLTLRVKGSYLWGRNETVGAPALGVMPLSGEIGLHYEPAQGRFFVEGTVRAVSDQERVAAFLGETSTAGYVTANLRGGVNFGRGVSVEGGVKNLTGAKYVNHLNAKNPYTSRPIYEPGRVFFIDVRYAF